MITAINSGKTNTVTDATGSIDLTTAMATIAPTKAALELERQASTVTPHKLIDLMLEGAIERVEQAKQTLGDGEHDEAGMLISKAVGIVGGLKDSLDLAGGGDIASNLDNLYEYITTRLCAADADTGDAILFETGQLLQEVKSGWQGITPTAAA